MSSTYALYERAGQKLEVALPLESRVNVSKFREELEIPGYVDLDNFQMEKAIVILWAVKNTNELFRSDSRLNREFRLAVFGGAGFKLHCPSSNIPGPLRRDIGDVDFVTIREDGRKLTDLLCRLHEVCGTRYFHGISRADKIFNSLQRGERFRLRAIKEVAPEGTPVPGIVDIFCDKLTFCHELDVREDLFEADRLSYTIGIENLILSKAQFIKKIPKAQAHDVTNRVIADYDDNYVCIGMETKDLLDVAAALIDHNIGKGNDDIDIDRIGRKLKQDWRLYHTVTLNLQKAIERNKELEKLGLNQEQIDTIRGKLKEIVAKVESAYRPRQPTLGRLVSKQWWEEWVEEVEF